MLRCKDTFSTNSVQIQQPIKKPRDYGTLATIFTVKGEQSVQNHNEQWIKCNEN